MGVQPLDTRRFLQTEPATAGGDGQAAQTRSLRGQPSSGRSCSVGSPDVSIGHRHDASFLQMRPVDKHGFTQNLQSNIVTHLRTGQA